MSHAEISGQPGYSDRHRRFSWRNTIIILVILTALGAGGWWVVQNGMLNQYLPQATQTSASAISQMNLQGVTASDASAQTTGASTTTGAQAQTFPGRPAGAPMGAPPAGAPPFGAAQGNAAATGDTSSTAASSGNTLPAGAPSGAVMATGQGTPGDVATKAATVEAVATAAPTEAVVIPAVAGTENASLLDANGVLVSNLDSGDALQLTGRSSDGDWLAVKTTAGDGWVKADQVIAFGLERLSSIDIPATIATGAGQPQQITDTPTLAMAVQVSNESAANAGASSTAGKSETTPAPTTPAQASAGAAETVAPAVAAPLTATVTLEDSRLNIRSGPNTDYKVLTKATMGDVFNVIGRTEKGDWLQIELADGSGALGWAAADYLEVNGDVSTLPVVQVEAPATPTETAPATSNSANSTAPASAGAVATIQKISTASATTSSTGLQGTIVFQQSRGGMIYAYNLDTGELTPLTSGSDPAISPDGSTVAFVRDGGEAGLYLIDITGANEHLLFNERSGLSSPKWSPDGSWIGFSRGDEYIECYDMGHNRCITPDEYKRMFKDRKPEEDYPLVKQYSYKLAAVDPNGENYHDIGSMPSAKALDWNEAGIVYQSSDGIQRTADATDAVNQLVAFDKLKPYYYDPDWQPNGGQIAFQVKGAAEWEIYVVNSDGTSLHGITQPVTTLVDELPSNVAPAYSPDGKYIVYLSNRGDDNSAGDWRLWVMNADGSNPRPLSIDIPIEYNFGAEQVVSWGA